MDLFRGRPNKLGALLIGCGGVLSSGCDLASGLQDVGGSLANPDAALLDRPGRKLASGAYSRLLVDGSLKDGGHVVALRTDGDEPQVAIVPYLNGNPCFIKPAVGFERLSSRIDVELGGVVSVQRDADENGRGKISFVDFDCNEVMESLPGATLPQIAFPLDSPSGLLTLTEERELYSINPSARTLTLIAENVSQARTSGNRLWSIEEGQLVVRSANLKELDRFGANVTDFVLFSGSDIETAYMDDEGLNVWNLTDGVTPVSAEACEPVALGADVLVYLQPCATRTLHVLTVGSRLGADSRHIKVLGPDNVVEHNRTLIRWNPQKETGEVIFLAAGEDGNRLMLGSFAGENLDNDSSVTLELTELVSRKAMIRGGFIYTDWDGIKGTLVEQKLDDAGTTTDLINLAEGVVQLPAGLPYSDLGVLTDFDGTAGTLKVLRKSGDSITRTILAEGVPPQTHSLDETGLRRAFVGDSEDGIVGTLYLTRSQLGSPGFVPTARPIGDYAHLDTARFLEQPSAIAYLARKPGVEFASLKAWLIGSELTLVIHDRVSEYRTVPWPAPGILYAVPSGDDAGLWFSKAR